MLCILLCAIALGVSAKRKDKANWTMETPDKVVGREGNRLILFCKFTHPYRDYRGNISIAWKKGQNKEFFKYTNYLLGGRFKNEILVNAEKRYKPRGNPRKYDASILIKKLKPEDDIKQIRCRVDLTEKPGEKFELDHGTVQIEDGGIRVSPVIGKRGGSAVLPCSFKPLNGDASSIVILWMKKYQREEMTVFNHTCSRSATSPCNNTLNKGGQYALVGKPKQVNASIMVKDLRLNDTGNYFCQVWIRNEGTEMVIQDETKLEVMVPAAILQLLIVSGDTLTCTAEGVPPADIMWIDPGNNTLTVNSSGTRVTRSPEKDQIMVELLQPSLEGSYHCVAKNQYWKDTREIFLHKEGMNVFKLALYIGLSSSAAVLLLAAFGLWFMKKDSRKGRSSVDPSVANDLKSQGAEPVLQEIEREPISYGVETTAETRNQAAPTPGAMDSRDSVYMAIIDHDSQKGVQGGEIQAGNSSLQDPAGSCMATNGRVVKMGDVSEDSEESSDALIYSTVHIRRRSEVEAMTDPLESPSFSLHGNAQRDSHAKDETAVIYATVVYSNKQSLDVSED